MKAKFGWSAALAMVVAVAACGGDDGGGKGGAKDKCRAFVKQVCEAEISCGVIDEDDLDDCREEYEDEAHCDEAVRVSKSFDECLDDLEDEDECSGNLPSSCEEVILIDD